MVGVGKLACENNLKLNFMTQEAEGKVDVDVGGGDPHFAAETMLVAAAIEKNLDHHSNSSHGADFPMPHGQEVAHSVSDVVAVAASRADVARDTAAAMARREEEADRWIRSLAYGGNGE